VVQKKGLLLINLGTPESFEPKHVGRYLREFLMDPLVIDIPKVIRWILVNILIVPRRSHASAKLYKKVWMKEGSPLLVHTQALESKVQKRLSERFEVVAAMRYGKPSIRQAILKLKESGVKEVVVLPLYPQYSLAATESSIVKAKEVFEEILPEAKIQFIPYFYQTEAYINAVTAVTQKYMKNVSWDRVLFSFHGLPERQVKKTDSTGSHCLKLSDCCKEINQANQNCYRAQSFATARALAERLGIKDGQYEVAFQSRLKGAPWIRPFSDDFYRELPKRGVKKLVVVSPSFVADCLETLEEVQMRGKEEFVENGGDDLVLIPSLNAEEPWVEAVGQIVENYQPNT
jgi:ferrochelatase